MNRDSLELCAKLLPRGYVEQAKDARRSHENLVKQLIEKRKLPSEGWSNFTIELLLRELSGMDTNNFPHSCGVGEREGRIYSTIVEQRHFGFAHGIGRSGDITAVQPKAAGSSLMMKLTNALVEDALKLAGARHVAGAFVVPMATGMSLLLCMRTLSFRRPGATYVLWPRIDQKSCYKSILTAGFIPVVIENCLEGDELRTDVVALEQKIAELGSDKILCILTTTSCFAPRAVDRLEQVALLGKQHDIPHLVNNAYGVQSSKCMHHIEQAARLGRLDAFVQSTDKNFMVPVGGSIIAGYDAALVSDIGKAYPGRASGSPMLDLFITMLSLGASGYQRLLSERKSMYDYLAKAVQECAAKHGQRVLHTPNNPISIAVTLSDVAVDASHSNGSGSSSSGSRSDVTEIGSKLFRRNVSGVRVVPGDEVSTVGTHRFVGFGAHCSSYPYAYLTAAATVGMTKDDVDAFVAKLDDVLSSATCMRLHGPLANEARRPIIGAESANEASVVMDAAEDPSSNSCSSCYSRSSKCHNGDCSGDPDSNLQTDVAADGILLNCASSKALTRLTPPPCAATAAMGNERPSASSSMTDELDSGDAIFHAQNAM